MFEGAAQAFGDATATAAAWTLTVLALYVVAAVVCLAFKPLRGLGNELVKVPLKVLGMLLAGAGKAGIKGLGKAGGRAAFEVWDLRARMGRVSDPEAPLVRFEERRPMDPPPESGPGS